MLLALIQSVYEISCEINILFYIYTVMGKSSGTVKQLSEIAFFGKMLYTKVL